MIKTSHIYTADHSQGSMIQRLNLLADHYSPESVLPKPLEFSQHMNLATFREHYGNFLDSYLPYLVRDLDMPHPHTAKYYAEKHMDGKSFGLFKTMLELFPHSKVIILFRDPRDVYLSYLSFSVRENIIKMTGGTEEKIERIMSHYSKRLELLEEFKEITHVVRYEDLMKAPSQTIRGLLNFLGLEQDDEVIRDMIEPLRVVDLQTQRHITAGSANESIGRWKKEMSELEGDSFNRYSTLIETLGYSSN